jgi:hypothetical protein
MLGRFERIFSRASFPETIRKYGHPSNINCEEAQSLLLGSSGWLYHKVGLNDLFDGGGLTKLADGSSGIPEYLFVNRRVEEFGVPQSHLSHFVTHTKTFYYYEIVAALFCYVRCCREPK